MRTRSARVTTYVRVRAPLLDVSGRYLVNPAPTIRSYSGKTCRDVGSRPVVVDPSGVRRPAIRSGLKR